MKTLVRVLVVVVVLAGVGAAWLRDSAWWSFIELHHGLQQRDVERVERVVALERFSASSTRALAAIAGDAAGGDGADVGAAVVGALARLVGAGVGDLVKEGAAQALRDAIRDGSLARRIGPFVVDEGWSALGGVTTTPGGALVELAGTCDGAPARLAFVLQRYDDGILGGHPRRYVITGIDEDSARQLARTCAAAARSSSSSQAGVR
jgi:hypothetical protein